MKIVGVLGNYFRPDRSGSPSPFGAYYLNKDYVDSFKNLDVLMVHIPYLTSVAAMNKFLDMVDGILLTGGFDIPSDFFGETEISDVDFTYDRERSIFELKILPLVEERGLPIFAICLGLQMFNVYRGGRLFQDVYRQVGTKIDHNASSKDTRLLAHEVVLVKESRISEYMSCSTALVNSSHHQAISLLGRELVATAHAPDGLIEAVECSKTNFFGVQWHPESLQYKYKEHARLFEAFVEML